MKLYYYAENNQQFGPFTLEELKEKRLKKTVLVWTEGMNNWVFAETVVELKDFVIPEPPPLPKEDTDFFLLIINTIRGVFLNYKKKINKNKIVKYDLTYERDVEAVTVGITLSIIYFVFAIMGGFQFSSQRNLFIFEIVQILVRIPFIIWVYKISIRQNRNSTAWGLFAFFTPLLALIIIGSLRKLKLNLKKYDNEPIEEQINVFNKKIKKFYKFGMYAECVELISKVLDIDNNNLEMLKLRGTCFYKIEKYDSAEKDFKLIYNNKEFTAYSCYYLGNIEIKRYNREKAVAYWLKSQEKGFKDTETKLNIYHEFYGKFLLDRNDLNIKLGVENFPFFDYSFNFYYYRSGINIIDVSETKNKLRSDGKLNSKGFFMRIKLTNKTSYIGLIYFEIENIIYRKSNNILNLSLINGKYIRLYPDEDMLYELILNYKKETGRKVALKN